MFTYILYAMAIIWLIFSSLKDKTKTKKALLTAWKSFENILPQCITVLIIVALFLAILDTEQISKILGTESGILGFVISAVIGSITLIPPYVSLPLVASLLKSGAGYPQMTMFLTTLTMVGIITLPVEIKYLGRKTAIKRNLYSFIFAVIISLIIGMVIL
ncbi:MAG: permease [Treponema sp.]|jgi:uncharacterized membrane protein YraQ (UPF0718 family)|nr:permease [Treponema sp.]